MSKANSELGQY